MSYPDMSDRCRVCGLDLRDRWRRAALVTDAAEWMRQIMEGACDPCQLRRQRAAVEFIAAADAVRLVWRWTFAAFGPAAIDHEPFRSHDQSFSLVVRLQTAERRCRDLGVWALRSWRLPDRLRDQSPFPTEREVRHAPHRHAPSAVR